MHVFLRVGSARVPLLVALVLLLELVHVELEAVGGGRHGAEVSLHAEVEARLETVARLGLVVVEVLVEVRHDRVVQLALVHAVRENNATGCFHVQTSVVVFARHGEGHRDFDCVFRRQGVLVKRCLRVHFLFL